jgi:hypothetical protein
MLNIMELQQNISLRKLIRKEIQIQLNKYKQKRYQQYQNYTKKIFMDNFDIVIYYELLQAKKLKLYISKMVHIFNYIICTYRII